MFTKIYAILFCFLQLTTNNFVPYDSCELVLRSTGVKDFSLGTELNDLLKKLGNYKKRNSEDCTNLIFFEDNFKFDNTRVKIEYKFVLKNNVLTGYTFLIDINDDIEGLKFFKSFVEEAKKYNEFVNGDKYSYMQTSKKCKFFLRTHSIELDKYIFGGINLIDDSND